MKAAQGIAQGRQDVGGRPGAGKLADRMVRHIQSWDGSILSTRIEAHSVDTPDEQLPEGALVIDKKQPLHGINIARAGGGFSRSANPWVCSSPLMKE